MNAARSTYATDHQENIERMRKALESPEKLSEQIFSALNVINREEAGRPLRQSDISSEHDRFDPSSERAFQLMRNVGENNTLVQRHPSSFQLRKSKH